MSANRQTPPAAASAIVNAARGLTAPAETRAMASPADARQKGSRRRRVWELASHAHCPVVGVCLPIHAVRRVVDKLLGGQTQAGDYELHCGVITECKLRSPVAEAVQRELDRRYAAALRKTQRLKDSAALGAWWREAQGGNDVAGALWATLTHARCDTPLEEQVLQDIHMLQHQVGTANRADLQRLTALHEENGVLARELAAAQQRSTQQALDHARKLEALQAALMQARAELISRDTRIATLAEDLRTLEQAVPSLRSRADLARQAAEQIERLQDLERALLRSRHETERERHRAGEALAALQQLQAQPPAGTAGSPDEPAADGDALETQFADRAVLCVGGRQASVPVYRQLIERVGGRFLHHDGGEEDNTSRLDTTLAAADLVICQTGCISHDAYWRVKDHCKRTGKRCLFVENPSSASLQRALRSPAGSDHREPTA
ncbi:MAG TPA: DUF2325 domain-containing protein [Ideonella sp.]|nr:DUF2325 domain-containing protein [Ideonella sp.]